MFKCVLLTKPSEPELEDLSQVSSSQFSIKNGDLLDEYLAKKVWREKYLAVWPSRAKDDSEVVELGLEDLP